jgi:hypothetical protein
MIIDQKFVGVVQPDGDSMEFSGQPTRKARHERRGK